MYLTYAEYVTMGGTLEEATFTLLEFRASKKIDRLTFSRLTKDTIFSNAVKSCDYRIIELLDILDNVRNHNTVPDELSVLRETNDGVSVSYNKLSAKEYIVQCQNEINNTIKEFLENELNQAGKKLLYRGIYPGE